MFSENRLGQAEPIAPAPIETAPSPLSAWRKFLLVVKVVELRLRFIALMAVTGLVFAYWDTIWNHYEKWMRPATLSQVAASGLEFFCPMHPSVVQDDPGSCPICGMTLSRRKHSERQAPSPGATARIELKPDQVRQAGIETVDVGYAPLKEAIKTVGYVAIDERRMANIVSKVPGKSRVEKLYANVTGMEVLAGAPLAELFSPELNQAIVELQTAAQRAAEPVQAQTALGRSLQGDRQEMVRASAEKLKRWGITEAQVDEILKQGTTDFKVTIYSPVRGHVFKKNVVEGQEVPEGYPMFEVVDLQSVWAQAQVYEHQLALVRDGQAVEASVEAFPGETFPGTVEFIEPRLDPSTRTVLVRFALENPELRLRPGMFATVSLQTAVAELPRFRVQTAENRSKGRKVLLLGSALQQKDCPVTSAALGSMGDPIEVQVEGRKVWTCCGSCPPKLKAQPARYLARFSQPPRGQVLSVPESSVIDTGAKTVVYVEVDPGIYEGREVVLGPRIGDRFPVLDGVLPGDRVAASGAFLIDAESRINPR